MNDRGTIAAERARALALLREARRFLLIGHERPDGDCLGAQAALHRGLESLGRQVYVVNPDPPNRSFDYLSRAVPFGAYEEGEPLPEHDVAVLLDFNDPTRCGAMRAPLLAAPSRKLVVDHHPADTGEPWWDAAFVDVSASATGVLVWRILRELGVRLDEVAALGVFTSIVTDTGWFRYSNTDAETFSIAADLVRAGVVPAKLFAAIYQRRPAHEPLALARLLGRTEYFGEGRLAVVDEPLDALEEHPSDGDAVLDVLRSVESVEVVLLLRELEAGLCKLSARSKTDFDVNQLARRFGGGGHAKAAGATIEGELEDVRERLVGAALEALGESA